MSDSNDVITDIVGAMSAGIQKTNDNLILLSRLSGIADVRRPIINAMCHGQESIPVRDLLDWCDAADAVALGKGPEEAS